MTYSLAVEITANVAKYVVCRDKEEAMAAAAAGVLWLLRARGPDEERHWTLTGKTIAPEYVGQFYDTAGWPPQDFAIRVEAEDDNNG